MCTLLWTLAGLYIVYRVLDYAIRQLRLTKLDEKYVLITGCDSGFGNKACKDLDGMGVHVFAGCFTEKGEDDIRKSCSTRAVALRLDVTSTDSIQQAFQLIKQKLPKGKGLWGLVNNAGLAGRIAPNEWLTKKDFMFVLDVNIFGLMEVTRVFLPLLKQARGRVVNTASVMGRVSMNVSAPYNMSKWCVEAYSDSLRREIGDFGITVHIVEPGYHKTNITEMEGWRTCVNAAYNELSTDMKEEYGEKYKDQMLDALIEFQTSGIISPDISRVVNTYIHALTATFPRGRYLVGNDARFFWYPLSLMPEWMSDFILAKLAGSGRPIPASVKNKKYAN